MNKRLFSCCAVAILLSPSLSAQEAFLDPFDDLVGIRSPAVEVSAELAAIGEPLWGFILSSSASHSNSGNGFGLQATLTSPSGRGRVSVGLGHRNPRGDAESSESGSISGSLAIFNNPKTAIGGFGRAARTFGRSDYYEVGFALQHNFRSNIFGLLNLGYAATDPRYGAWDQDLFSSIGGGVILGDWTLGVSFNPETDLTNADVLRASIRWRGTLSFAADDKGGFALQLSHKFR